jgi:hypothetical protein
MMETFGFKNDRAAREELYNEWKAEGSEGLARYTTHLQDAEGKFDPAIVYAVTRRIPDPMPSTSVPLPESAADAMIDEGGNTNEGTITETDSEESATNSSRDESSS